ncbi:MAG: 3'-5' exonuclease [Oscillospiraceae bacterium]|nr:3'-5' exonuclease [Oscillospiraceae bacterium]
MPISLFNQFDRLVFLDVETTGIDCKADEIIELAALVVVPDGQSYRMDDEMGALISLSEGKKLPDEITKLTGLTEQMLLDMGEPKDLVCRKFAELLDVPKTLVVAYNAQFDLRFLYFFLKAHHSAHVLQHIKMLDALTIYKDRRDYPHKLSDAISAYGLASENTHRAIDDTKATMELLAAMAQEKDDLAQYINLFGFNPKYGVSGPKISSIKYTPQSYKREKRLYEYE